MGDQTSQNTQTDRDRKVSIIVPIIAAIVGIFSVNINVENNKLNDDNDILISENDILKDNIKRLEEKLSQYDYLESENEKFKSEIENLNYELNQYSTLKEDYDTLLEENESLENEIDKLRSEIKTLKENNQEQEIQSESDSLSSDIQTDKKTSIFDMDTFRGEDNWEIPTSKGDYTDTYGNEYTQAHIACHYSSTKNDRFMPTYLLDKKYSECEGQIAWTKRCKNSNEKAWIDFYSDDKLIYSTDIITATDRVLTFNFSVENLETLTIIQNSTKEADLDSIHDVYIIYPYFNLIE